MFKFIAAAALALVTTFAAAATDINKAGQAELEAVKGIGPSMAQRMLDARKSGPFADWADLRTRVKGVGEGKAAKLSENGLTVNGKAYTASAPAVYKAPKPKADKAEKKADKLAS